MNSHPSPAVTPTAREVDVLDISDLRFPGGTSHSIAEEIRAQHTAGWTTGLLHLNGPLVSKVMPVNPLLRREIAQGHAQVLVGSEPIRASVVVIRHPAVLQHAVGPLPTIETDRVVLVANAPPLDIDGHQHYHPEIVHAMAREAFGCEPLWAPIGPLVRDTIRDTVPAGSMMPTDWVNIIDVDAWSTPRTRWAGDRPVIGRHSRDSPQKWPRDVAQLRAAYPTDGSVTVKVLGGAAPAQALLGTLPASWQVLPFGSMPVKDFLAGLDFFVYYHDPAWVEAFGRTILEALASGVPAILPPHFDALFGDAAVYAQPDEVAGIVTRLRGDRAAYDRLVARGRDIVRQRFGHEAHVTRITELIGAPATPPPFDGEARSDDPSTPVLEPASEASVVERSTPPAPVSVTARPDRPRALFISSNGAGMGHLTRLLAYARRCEPELEPHFLSLSQAVGVVGEFGYGYEYLPSTGSTGMAPRQWHPFFVERVCDTIGRIRPSVAVFDGTWPYDGIPAVREKFPDVGWVWSRRGMWRKGKNPEQLKKAPWFDAVIEPGDFSSAADGGATVAAPSHRVGPVTLLDVDEIEDRATARASLGLDPDAPLALVALGAGNINDTSGDLGAAAEALQDLGVGVCVTDTQIARSAASVGQDVTAVRAFPLSRHLRAFDLAVSAVGYNSFHEMLRFGVPTLFVPNTHTSLDDQEGRSGHADQQGWAYSRTSLASGETRDLLASLLADGRRMVDGLSDPGNGAAAAARVLIDIAHRHTAVAAGEDR